MKKFFIALLVLLCANLLRANNPAITLVQNHHSNFRIVIPANATDKEMQAAQLLQQYLQKASNALLPIISDTAKRSAYEILVGYTNRIKDLKQSNFKNIQQDGFRYFGVKNMIVFLGNENGLIYGVVDFLEKYIGCRKYAVHVEVIPSIKNILLPKFNVKDSPVNTFRVVYGNFAKDKDYKIWQRQNTIDDIFADGYYVHTLGKLIPPAVYFNSHPEYFALINNKRVTDQPCLSNDSVLQITIRNLKEEMAKQPNKKFWSVSQNDNYTYCHCPLCEQVNKEEGSPAGTIIRFVNKVAAAFPDKVISTLAYQYSRKAPLKVKPASNVQIMLCTIELDRSKPIQEQTGSDNFVKDIQDWGNISHHIYLWDYTVNFSHHVSPFPNIHTLQPNIQFFTKNNAHEHFQQSNTDNGHEFSELKNYLIARLLWNPNVNVDSVMNDFMNGYYGAAGIFIKQYNTLLEKTLIESKKRLDLYEPPINHSDDYLSQQNVQEYNMLFNKAEKAVTYNPALLLRVKVARLPLQYAMFEIGKNDIFGSRGWFEKVNGKYVVKQSMKDMLENFYTICNQDSVKTLSEGGLKPDDYYKASLRSLEIKIDNNKAFGNKVDANPLPTEKYNKGNLQALTDGVQGSSDYRTQWLGWEGKDAQLLLDLKNSQPISTIQIGALYDPHSWILLPKQVQLYISDDNSQWHDAGTIAVEGDQKQEDVVKNFLFKLPANTTARYIKFQVTGTKTLPVWHPSAGYSSWFFLDEIIVE